MKTPLRRLPGTLVRTGLALTTLVSALAQAPTGNPERGAALFEGKAACQTCHRIKDKGSRLGPDLTDIGGSRKPDELRKAILDPPSQVQPQNRIYRVVTKDGVTISGKLLNQGTASLQLLDTNERLVSLQKSSLREYGLLDPAPMPSGRNTLTAGEIEDLVAFLAQSKGVSQ